MLDKLLGTKCPKVCPVSLPAVKLVQQKVSQKSSCALYISWTITIVTVLQPCYRDLKLHPKLRDTSDLKLCASLPSCIIRIMSPLLFCHVL